MGQAWWTPGVGAGAVFPAGPGSLNKETDHVAWAPSPVYPRAPGQFGPSARSAAAWTCLWPWAGAGLLQAWPGPSDMGILAAFWPGYRDGLDVSLTGAEDGQGLCKPHPGAGPTWACPPLDICDLGPGMEESECWAQMAEFLVSSRGAGSPS